MFEALGTMLGSELMQRAFIVAILVGACAPIMGTYLVQRRLAMLGDGIGHVALTGVALGWLVGNAMNLTDNDALAVPGAIVASVLGALLIEWVRIYGKTSGDVALAMLFYGGIAGGVLLISIAGGTTANLTGYLFGSIAVVSDGDVAMTVLMAVLLLLIGLGLRGPLFSLCQDEEFARATGLPTGLLSSLIAVLAALTVAISMRVVGVLLVSALMIVPVAISQLVSHSFRATMGIACTVSTIVCVTGLTLTYFYDFSPGSVIVVLALAVYGVLALAKPLFRHHHHPADPHPHMRDDVLISGDDRAENDTAKGCD